MTYLAYHLHWSLDRLLDLEHGDRIRLLEEVGNLNERSWQGVLGGKGAGYSDIEVALLTEAGLIGPETAIVTTVHQLQVVDDELPETEHDFSVDMIVTPDEVIECGPPRRPNGIVLRHLTEEKIAAIPVLAGLSSSLTQRR